jgi:hypothetical protein
MSSWTQADVDRITGKQQAAKRTETPHKRGNPKTATTVGEKVERETVAARVQPHAQEIFIWFGVDPGTHTGLAQIYDGQIQNIETTTIFDAIKTVEANFKAYGKRVFVRFEDARLRKWFGKSGPEKWKGAGSIMRDCAIWEETLTSLGIPFEKVAPRDVKATTAEQFEKITGWKSRTSIHAREAAWLILPYLKQK